MEFRPNRQTQRHSINVDVEVIDLESGIYVREHTKDLSLYGCGVSTATPFLPGTKVMLKMAYGQEEITVFGKVIYGRQDIGMGIVFTIVEPKDLETIVNWIAERTICSEHRISTADPRGLSPEQKPFAQIEGDVKGICRQPSRMKQESPSSCTTLRSRRHKLARCRRGPQMKCIELLILALLTVTGGIHAADDSSTTRSGHFPREGEPSQFKPGEVVVEIGKRHIDARKSLNHIGLAVVSNSGTGYCFGQGKCNLILTNYHVAERIKSPLRVNGVEVLQTYEATSSQDNGSIWEKSPFGFYVKLVPVRDIAILRMKHPLKGMHGILFSTRELHEGEHVRISGHPGGGRLTTAEATFFGEAEDGLLFFKVKAGEEKLLVPGISGALVANEENEAVGLVQGIANGNMAAVVPVWSLADFVKKVQPNKFPSMFSSPPGAIYRPNNSELLPVNLIAESEALAKNIGPEFGMSPPPALPEDYLWYDSDRSIPGLTPRIVNNGSTHTRAVEPHNVQALRINADRMVESLNDLIAVGTQRSFGGNSPEVTAQYQLRMVAGSQTFTLDGKEMFELPCPKGNGYDIGSDWSAFPQMLGNNLNLSIQQVEDLSLPGWGRIKVFRYEAKAEDKVEQIKYCTNYGLGFHTEKTISVSARGEVWTDDAMNILRVTQELLAPPSMGWVNLHDSVLFGWLESPKRERRLVPTNIISIAELTDDHKLYSTLCRITDYHRFSVSVVVGDQILGPMN